MSDWIQAAMSHGGHLAAALDLSASALQLVDCGLATEGTWIEIAPQLSALVANERGLALRDVAQLLLMSSPPPWLRLIVSETGVSREYIPKEDLAALGWLEPDLDQMLKWGYEQLPSAETASLEKAIGDAGELFVLASLRYAGARATHVAQFSDAFGYDIEVSSPSRQRIEVKAAGPKTSGQFYLSRNEFIACQHHGSEWRLVQVVFDSSAFIAKELNCSHIARIHAVTAESLQFIVPPDTERFSWQESAKIRPDQESWIHSGLALDPAFRIPGFAVPLSEG